MKGIFKRNKLGKNSFRSVYCPWCRNKKSCGLLDEEKRYCCPCYSQKVLVELEKDGLLIDSAQEALNDYRSGKIICQCLGTKKPRVKYTSYDGTGWIKCEGEKCKNMIASAGHHGVIKNRNDPKFWGLEVKERVLCGGCLESKKGEMKPLKRAKFNEYKKLGRL